MTLPRNGALLSAEQSVRLAIVDSVERQKLLQEIVGLIRATAARTAYLPDGDAPAMIWKRLEI